MMKYKQIVIKYDLIKERPATREILIELKFIFIYTGGNLKQIFCVGRQTKPNQRKEKGGIFNERSQQKHF